jgi:hypothetical protein
LPFGFTGTARSSNRRIAPGSVEALLSCPIIGA